MELTVYNVLYIPTSLFPTILPIIVLSDTLNTCVAIEFPISGILNANENFQYCLLQTVFPLIYVLIHKTNATDNNTA